MPRARKTEAEIIALVESRKKFGTPVKGGPPPQRISIDRYGQHASYVKDGYRWWGFDEKRGRDTFADDYEKHSVVLNARPYGRS